MLSFLCWQRADLKGMVVQEWLLQSSIAEIRKSVALGLGVAMWHAFSICS